MSSIEDILIYLVRKAVLPDASSQIDFSGVDWPALIEIADCQGVAVLASDGLQTLFNKGLYQANDDKEIRRLKARWFGKTVKYEQRYFEQLNAAKKMADWLASSGIQTVVLKGLTVSECYPISSHRYSSDFDCFLVKEGEHFNAWEEGNKVIEEHGLTVGRSFYKNSAFHIDGLYVENHKFCTPCRGNKTLIRLERMLQQIILDGPLTPLGDTGLWVPPAMFSAIFLTEHAYSHFLHEGLNLKHIIDWMMFRRKHSDDIDWIQFDIYCKVFGFTRFVESMNNLGEFVLGARDEHDLTTIDLRMLASIWEGLRLHPGLDRHSIRAKFAFAGNTLRAAWKYRAYSNISMLRALWIQVKGYMFIKNPSLS